MEPFGASSALPPLRGDLDIAPFEHEGRSLFLVRDAEAEGDEALALSPGGLAVAALFDGRRAAAEVAAELSKQAGADIPAEDVLRVAQQLSAAGLLDTDAVRQRRRARLEEFLKAPTRPAVFQGRGGYPDQSAELARFLGRFFEDPKGPGRPLPAQPTRPGAWGLVAPHIDFHRGGPAYAWSYAALADSPPPDVVIALGVAHASPDSPWVMTRKAYETPFGRMAVDEGLYDDIAKSLWYDPRVDEWVHRREHSLEFQAVWLRRLWGEKAPPWVPILCSTFERFSPDKAPSATPTVEEALRAIGALLAARAKKQRVLILAGIDLAHVGPRFGDEIELTPEVEKKIEREDRASLERALALDADGFYLSVVKDDHWRKVCGLSALYTALRWIKDASGGAAKGELLTYGQAPDPAGGVVSFTSAIYR